MMQSSGEGCPLTPKQSLTRKQSLIRRSLAALSVALLAGAWAIGISTPASAAPAKALEIVSVTNTQNSNLGLLVQDQTFAVEVRVVNNSGRPTTVKDATTISLTASGPGTLTGVTEETIPANGSGARFSDLTYSPFDNDVVLTVSVVSGEELLPDEITVDFALTAVRDIATRGVAFDLDDTNCGAGNGVPTSDEPTCGHLLTTGAEGPVVMSVGSCEGLGPDPDHPTTPCRTVNGITGLVVTLNANIQHSQDDPHSTMIMACDKVLCGGTGVPKLPVFYTLQNTGPLNDVAAPACTKKGVLDEGLKACVDYVSSMRSDGDLYLFVLFDLDARWSG
jgi:hypothetical protein